MVSVLVLAVVEFKKGDKMNGDASSIVGRLRTSHLLPATILILCFAVGAIVLGLPRASATGSPEEVVRDYLEALANGDSGKAEALLSTETKRRASATEMEEAFKLQGVAKSAKIDILGVRPLDAVNVLVEVGFGDSDGARKTTVIPVETEGGSWHVKPTTRAMMTRDHMGPYPAEAMSPDGTLRFAVGGLVIWKSRPSIGLDIEVTNVSSRVVRLSPPEFSASLSDGSALWGGEVGLFADDNPFGSSVSPTEVALQPGRHLLLQFEVGGGDQLSDSGLWTISVGDGDGLNLEMRMDPAMSDALDVGRWLTLSGDAKTF